MSRLTTTSFKLTLFPRSALHAACTAKQYARARWLLHKAKLVYIRLSLRTLFFAHYSLPSQDSDLSNVHLCDAINMKHVFWRICLAQGAALRC